MNGSYSPPPRQRFSLCTELSDISSLYNFKKLNSSFFQYFVFVNVFNIKRNIDIFSHLLITRATYEKQAETKKDVGIEGRVTSNE